MKGDGRKEGGRRERQVRRARRGGEGWSECYDEKVQEDIKKWNCVEKERKKERPAKEDNRGKRSTGQGSKTGKGYVKKKLPGLKGREESREGRAGEGRGGDTLLGERGRKEGRLHLALRG